MMTIVCSIVTGLYLFETNSNLFEYYNLESAVGSSIIETVQTSQQHDNLVYSM